MAKIIVSLSEASRIVSEHYDVESADITLDPTQGQISLTELESITRELVSLRQGNKIPMIKYVRTITRSGLKEAKDYVEDYWFK
jgi:ribosomal protein L7/L12